jgi:hypothetical protein
MRQTRLPKTADLAFFRKPVYFMPLVHDDLPHDGYACRCLYGARNPLHVRNAAQVNFRGIGAFA